MTIYDENNVPVLTGSGGRLGLSPEKLKRVESKKQAALKAEPDDLRKLELTGESVVIHNADPSGPPFTSVVIGGSDFHQALTEAIGAHDAHLGDPDSSQDHVYPPDWVASTHKELAEALADYYSCEVRDIAEVL